MIKKCLILTLLYKVWQNLWNICHNTRSKFNTKQVVYKIAKLAVAIYASFAQFPSAVVAAQIAAAAINYQHPKVILLITNYIVGLV